MENDLRECIEELRKSKAKEADICAKIKEEGSSYRKRCCDERLEFEQYIAKERRKSEIRLAGERAVFELEQADKENEFNEKVKLMREETVILREKVDSLEKNVISVRLGDLIEELANLRGVSTSDIMMSTYAYITGGKVYTIEAIYELMKQRKNKDNNFLLRVVLNSNSFCYDMEPSADLDSIQADDKAFIAHCTIRPAGISTRLCANINCSNLIISIPLSKLPIESNLITQAVINCVEKSQEKEVSKDNAKKRSRKLSDEIKKVEVND